MRLMFVAIGLLQRQRRGFAKQERLFMGSEAGGPVEQIAIETY